MKVILLYVSSLDGKVTKWGERNIYSWTSSEDVKHFRETISKNNLLVMGSTTFNAAHPKPQEGILRLVLTRTPQDYTAFAVPDQLEFVDLQPQELVEKYSKLGYEQMLLVSGRTVTTEFLKQNLVDELWLTLEPKLFGAGDLMVTETKLDIDLQLFETKQLNTKGTLLLKYKLMK